MIDDSQNSPLPTRRPGGVIVWILFARKKYCAALVVTSLPLLLALPLVG